MQFGQTVMVEGVDGELDSALDGLLGKQLFKEGGQMCVRLGDSTVPYHTDFRLYLSTAQPAPRLSPEVCVKVRET